jgi:hypothetical protein
VTLVLRILATLCTIALVVAAAWMPAHEGDRWTAWACVVAGVVIGAAIWWR